MIYKLTKNDIFKDNPELELVPEFASATDRQLKYMMLVYDYESPLRTLDDNEKKEKALAWAGYLKEKNGQWDKNARNARDGKAKGIEHAKNVFMSIQKNTDVYLLHGVRQQIREIVDFLGKQGKSAAEMEKAIKFVDSLKGLKQREKELQEFLNITEETIVKVDNEVTQTVSMLDQVNQESQEEDE